MTDRCKWLIGPMLALAAATGLAGCSGGTVTSSSIVPGGSKGGDPSQLEMEKKLIKHIVIIVQENRSFDNMFNGYPGADSAQFGTIHSGQSIPLQQVSIAEGYNISHTGKAFFTAWNKGKLDSFDLEAAGNVGNAHGYILVPPNPQYAYVPPEENKPYWLMAANNSLADRMFQSNIDASFVAHQYLIRGWASSTVDNPQGVPWGCDAPTGNVVSTLLANQKYGPFVSPCFDATTLGDELNAAHKTWHYYAPQVLKPDDPKFNYGAVWSAYGAIKHIRYDPRQWGTSGRLNVRWPETDILKDVPRGDLADVTWITPKLENSDHPSCFTTNGPSWVSDIVNTIGQSKFWKDTAIIVTWDDAGGWYDHVPPPLLDYDGPGFRVPLIVVSPYAKRGYVSHVQYETGSELKLVENVFGLGQLAASDSRGNDLTDMFDFTQAPRKFVYIQHDPQKGNGFFINQTASSWDPPDDM